MPEVLLNAQKIAARAMESASNGDDKGSVTLFKDAAELFKTAEQYDNYAQMLINASIGTFKIKDFAQTLALMKSALVNKEHISNSFLSTIYLQIAQTYITQKQAEIAKQYAEEAYERVLNETDAIDKAIVEDMMVQLYFELSLFDKAVEFSKKLLDSVILASIKFETPRAIFLAQRTLLKTEDKELEFQIASTITAFEKTKSKEDIHLIHAAKAIQQYLLEKPFEASLEISYARRFLTKNAFDLEIEMEEVFELIQ